VKAAAITNFTDVSTYGQVFEKLKAEKKGGDGRPNGAGAGKGGGGACEERPKATDAPGTTDCTGGLF